MKKLGFIVLILGLLLAGCTAYAASGLGTGDLVVRNGELAAFMNENGSVFVSGLGTPVNTTPAGGIVSIDAYRIVYFAKNPENRLISLELGVDKTFNEQIVTDDACAACAVGDSIYYVKASDPRKVMVYDVVSEFASTAYSGKESVQYLYATADGAVAALVDNAGTFLLNGNGTAIAVDSDVAAEIFNAEDFDVWTSEAAVLYVKEADSSYPVRIDAGVKDWAVIGKTVYYLTGTTDSMTLKSYNITNELWKTILEPSIKMQLKLTASENTLFMISEDNVVYCVDTANRRLVRFVSLKKLSKYSVSEGELTGYRIEAVSGQLNVYGIAQKEDVLPTFSFVSFSSEIVEDTSTSTYLLEAHAVTGENTVWELLQPVEQYTTLRKGNRGQAVAAIQTPLYNLGYYDYRIDGIFGWRTERAVRLLQDDLGLYVNGVADPDLQRIILGGKLGAYDPYKQLTKGDRGLRVIEMQERLRDLGYLADDADGIFGPRTKAAVETFQEENGLKVTGIANSKTLKALFDEDADYCTSYIEMRSGDTGYRVRELNQRLKKLYYLEGSVGDTYNSATCEAIRRFRSQIGMSSGTSATVELQQKLFASGAPEYRGYITLRRGDRNSRVRAMQRRLKELGYLTGSIDGYFGNETQTAVRLFQRAAGLRENGIATVETLICLFDDDAPEYYKPQKITAPVVYFSSFTKYADNTYTLTDSDTVSGNATLMWFAYGDVDSYSITIKDDFGTVWQEALNMPCDMDMLSIPVSVLPHDRTYSIKITANPCKGAGKSQSTTEYFVYSETMPDPEPEEIGKIDSLIVTPDGEGISVDSGVYRIPANVQGQLVFRWQATGQVGGYSYCIADKDGSAIVYPEGIGSTVCIAVSAEMFNADTLYKLTVQAVPVNGTLDDAFTQTISFKTVAAAAETSAPEEETASVLPEGLVPTEEDIVPEAAPEEETVVEPIVIEAPGEIEQPEATVMPETTATPEPTPEPTMEPLEEQDIVEEPTEDGIEYDVMPVPAVDETENNYGEPEYEPTEEPIDAAEDVENPEPASVTPELTPESTPEPTPEPVPVTIDSPMLSVSPAVLNENGVLIVEKGTITFEWHSEGETAAYDIRIIDSYGNTCVDTALSNESASMSSDNLEEGMVYTLSVTAHAAEDTNVTSESSVEFMLPINEEEVAEPEADYEPTVESEASDAEQVAEEETEEAYDEYVSDEEDYEYKPEPEEEPDSGEEPEPEPEEVIPEEPAEEEEIVSQDAYEEPEEEENVPEQTYEEPEDADWEEQTGTVNIWDEPITAYSPSDTIMALQNALQDGGWLDADFSYGVLDEATVNAVISFQSFIGADTIDPNDPYIDTETLYQLFN